MKREIKFRAWQVYMKQMFHTINSNHKNESMNAIFNDDNFLLMQYTGLKDKNGKEIYEGDIIHRHLHVHFCVEFIGSTWIATPKHSVGLYLNASQFIECEVIGNIHENPELI